MAIIANNNSIVPFLGERLSFIRGLDPLGLQNTSDATFSMLLPGLNNVTGRIRYYSFYCWLLDMYSKEVGKTDEKEQKKFIRRAEFIIALIAQYTEGEKGSIAGSSYASREIAEKTAENNAPTYDLQASTYKPDGSTRDTYWNYSGGAFGQYYLGSMRDIGIITARDNKTNVFVRTPKNTDGGISGEDLAEAFEKNINSNEKGLFLKSIENGIISEETIKQLIPLFNLTLILDNSEEQTLLTELLLQKDFPHWSETDTIFRKQTIKYLLQYYQKELNGNPFDDRTFVYYCYDGKGAYNEAENDCLLGWYYYQMNEFWQYACTSILNGTLSYLESTGYAHEFPLAQLVKEITDKVIESYKTEGLIKNGEKSVGDFLKNVSDSEYDEYAFFDGVRGNEDIEKITNAFLLNFELFNKNKTHLVKLQQYSVKPQIAKDGNSISYFLAFDKHFTKPLHKYIYDFIFVNIIYRHQYVAFRKMGTGTQSTQKFIIENQHIRFLGNFDATYTGPRIRTLNNFLKDLQIITNDNALTLKGESLLNKLLNS